MLERDDGSSAHARTATKKKDYIIPLLLFIVESLTRKNGSDQLDNIYK